MKLSILGTDDQSKVEDVTPLNFISYEALIKDECAKPEMAHRAAHLRR